LLDAHDAHVYGHSPPFLLKTTGEVDRARAIFTHGAQFENPKRVPDFWKAWHDFEVLGIMMMMGLLMRSFHFHG